MSLEGGHTRGTASLSPPPAATCPSLSRIGVSVKQQFTEEEIYKDRDSQIAAIEKTFEDAQKAVRRGWGRIGVSHPAFGRRGCHLDPILHVSPILPPFRSHSTTANLASRPSRSCPSSLTSRYSEGCIACIGGGGGRSLCPHPPLLLSLPQMWINPCAQVIFDSDPAPKDTSGAAALEMMSQAMIR